MTWMPPISSSPFSSAEWPSNAGAAVSSFVREEGSREAPRAQLRVRREAVVLFLKGLRGCVEDARPTPVPTV